MNASILIEGSCVVEVPLLFITHSQMNLSPWAQRAASPDPSIGAVAAVTTDPFGTTSSSENSVSRSPILMEDPTITDTVNDPSDQVSSLRLLYCIVSALHYDLLSVDSILSLLKYW